MKKTIELFLVLAMLTSFVGCDNEFDSSFETDNITNEFDSSFETDNTTTVAETTPNKEEFSLDTVYNYHDITIPAYSEWEKIEIAEGFICPETSGHFTFQFDSYDSEEACNEILKLSINTYYDTSNSSPQINNVHGVDISMFSYQTDTGYAKNYIFTYNNCIYEMNFYSTAEHYKNCSMFQNSDYIINSITFNNFQTTEPATEKTVEHRSGENFVGISNKKLSNDGIKIYIQNYVENDLTGNWRLGKTSDQFNIEEYALDYYNNYFASDDEIHAVVNFTYNTTTRISAGYGYIFVTVFEYVEDEEHDAKELFGGTVLADYNIYIDNGDIEKLELN